MRKGILATLDPDLVRQVDKRLADRRIDVSRSRLIERLLVAWLASTRERRDGEAERSVLEQAAERITYYGDTGKDNHETQ